MTNATQTVRNHPNFDADDFAYLVAKGWTSDEIVARWSEEAKRGDGPCKWAGLPDRAKLAAVTGHQKIAQTA